MLELVARGHSPRLRSLTNHPMHSFWAQQVHVKMHIVKNTGSMNLMVDLNDKPLRLIPVDTTYMLAEDMVADKVICNGEAIGVA